jgi:hypothetical protein
MLLRIYLILIAPVVGAALVAHAFAGRLMRPKKRP